LSLVVLWLGIGRSAGSTRRLRQVFGQYRQKLVDGSPRDFAHAGDYADRKPADVARKEIILRIRWDGQEGGLLFITDPAMAAGLTDKLLSMEDVAAMIDARALSRIGPRSNKKRSQISNSP
jgi:hypothetical protein